MKQTNKGNNDKTLPSGEDLNESITDHLNDFAVFTTDADGRITSWNSEAEKIFGYTAEEINGQLFNILSMTEEAEDCRNSKIFLRQDGTHFHASIKTIPLKNADGIGHEFLRIVRDESLQTDTEKKLRQAERRIGNILESFSDAFFTVDRDWRFTYVNGHAEAILGRTRDDLIGKNIWEEFPESIETVVHDYYHQAVNEQKAVSFEVYYPPFDSWFEVRAYPSADGLSVYSQNISERKRADAVLRESEWRYRTLFNSIDEGFCVLQMMFDENERAVDFKFLEINPAFEKLTGISAEDALSEKTMREIVPDLEEKWYEIYGGVALTGKPVRVADISEALNRWFDVYPFRIGEPEDRKVAVLFNNITERKLVEETLRESRERLKFTLEAAEIGDWDLDLITGKATRSFLHDKCFGATEPFKEWSYEKFLSFVHPDDKEEVDKKFGRALNEQKEWSFVCRVLWADKSVHWIEGHGNIYRTKEGKPARMLGIITEITKRKQAEKNLEFLSEISQELIRMTDIDEIMLSVGAKIGEYLNLSICAFIEVNETEDTVEVKHEWHREDVPKIAGIYRIGDFVNEEFQQASRAGEIFFSSDVDTDPRVKAEQYLALSIGSFVAVPLVRDGVWQFTLGIYRSEPHNWSSEEIELIRELTTRIWTRIERARAEKTLRESEEQLRALADSIPQLAWMAEPDGYIFWYNQRWYEYTDTTPEEMKGWGWQSVHDKEILPKVLKRWQSSIQTGEPFEMEFPLLRGADKKFRWFLTRVIPIRDSNAQIVRWFGTNTDIEELRQARLHAEQANSLKDDFLATLSHELRTPLNAILGWSQMLRINRLGENDAKKALDTIERNARFQSQLIDDILDISRIITGKLRLDVRSVDLPGVVAAAVDAVRPAAEAKNIRLQMLLDPQAGPTSGDSDRLQQVIWNLLSNAVKFTPKNGRVQVRLERVNSHIEIVVSDTGKGIEPEFLPHVFDRFRQLDGSMTRRHGGLGLGLAIVRQLVELHGGTVSVESEGNDQGATFTVSLPLLPVRKEIPGDTPRVHPRVEETGAQLDCPPELTDLQILVVDDEADSRELVNIVLSECGAVIMTANSAREAYEIVQREKFDIIISDIGMPEEDGFSLIGRLRQLPDEEGGNTPAIALTAYARAEDRVRALRSGFQMHIAKPVEPAELIAAVGNLAGRMRNPKNIGNI